MPLIKLNLPQAAPDIGLIGEPPKLLNQLPPQGLVLEVERL
jgi:hypothetical protein